jgi:hypothetical protein
MSNVYIISPNGGFFCESELYHHGIKGQRWGIRRYQKEDGSLTPAGKKRYYDTPELNKQKSEVDAAKSALRSSRKVRYLASNDLNIDYTDANLKALKKAERQVILDRAAVRRSKLKYDTNKEVARIQDKGIEFKNKSKHRLRLEEQYKKAGMTDEQAQAAANNRIRTEKLLAASAALTVGACALYVANKYRKERIDGVIKAGETLQRIEMQDTGGKLHDTFYVAQGKHDMKRYENMLGACRQRQTGHAYMMKLEATSDIKVASRDKARKVFGELYKTDPEFKKAVAPFVKEHYGGRNRIINLDDVSDRNIKKMYDNFNTGIVEKSMRDSGADQKFYAKLKSAGYGAIHDINDMKYSGYNAKKPLIVFDNSKNNIMVKSMNEMKGNLQGKGMAELAKAQAEEKTKYYVERIGPLSAAGLTATAVSTYRSNPAVQNYKNQHPNTNMTDRQIAEMLGV